MGNIHIDTLIKSLLINLTTWNNMNRMRHRTKALLLNNGPFSFNDWSYWMNKSIKSSPSNLSFEKGTYGGLAKEMDIIGLIPIIEEYTLLSRFNKESKKEDRNMPIINIDLKDLIKIMLNERFSLVGAGNPRDEFKKEFAYEMIKEMKKRKNNS